MPTPNKSLASCSRSGVDNANVTGNVITSMTSTSTAPAGVAGILISVGANA